MRHCGQLHRGGRGHIPSSGCLYCRHLLEAAIGFGAVSVSRYAAGHFTVFSIFKLHFLSGFFLLSSCSRSREGQNQLAGSQLQFLDSSISTKGFPVLFAGSTDCVCYSTVGTNDAETSALHIIVGESRLLS